MKDDGYEELFQLLAQSSKKRAAALAQSKKFYIQVYPPGNKSYYLLKDGGFTFSTKKAHVFTDKEYEEKKQQIWAENPKNSEFVQVIKKGR